MHATTDATTLRDALAQLRKHAGRGTLPASKLAALTVTGSGSMTVRRWTTDADVTANIAADGPTTPGTVHVDADALTAAIGKGRGPVTISVTFGDASELHVTRDGGSAAVRLADGADFPAADGNEYAHCASIMPDEVARVASVARAAGRYGDARAVLTGIAITANGDGTGEAVATDTYRMHVAKLARVSGDPGASVIIDAGTFKVAKSASAGIDVAMTDDGRRYSVAYTVTKGTKRAPRVTHYRVTGWTIEGPFPNYRSLIPNPQDANARWTVADAAGTASVLAGFRNRLNVPAIMTPAGSAVAVSAAFADGTKLDVIAPMQPDAPAIGLDDAVAFNPDYFADGLTHAGDGATVRLRDALRAAIIEGEHGYALVMPMRVS